jgi:inosine/xanthosine triphosphatase
MIFPKRQNFQAFEKFQASEKPLIIVGSKNPVKISCTEVAFTEAFNQGFIVNGVNVSSMVADQPIGDEETFLGAKNRAVNSKSVFPEADYWVGIEGGVARDKLGMSAFAWIYIEDKAGRSGWSKTGSFYLPKAIADLVDSGMELGTADDQFFSKENSKQSGGSVGILTNGVLDRSTYYQQAIVLALIPFLSKKLF